MSKSDVSHQRIPLPVDVAVKKRRSLTMFRKLNLNNVLKRAEDADKQTPQPTGPFESVVTRKPGVSYLYEDTKDSDAWFTAEPSYDFPTDITLAPEQLKALQNPTVPPSAATETSKPGLERPDGGCLNAPYGDKETCEEVCFTNSCKETA